VALAVAGAYSSYAIHATLGLSVNPAITETPDFDSSATAVISHHVKADQQSVYEQWLCEIIPVCKRYPGHLGVQVIRPVADATTTYTIIIRYETRMQLLAWLGSAERKQLVDKVRPLLSEDDKFEVLSGLDFWFTPAVAKAKPPVRWKQFLLSWSVIYPLVLIVPVIIEPLIRHMTLFDNHYVRTLVISAIVVALVVYVIMPRYTKLVGRWLLR
jgi:antibiotic biosynthesis monooxygenase (ABM) superfamily enzyme